jgi:hypothetical protein
MIDGSERGAAEADGALRNAIRIFYGLDLGEASSLNAVREVAPRPGVRLPVSTCSRFGKDLVNSPGGLEVRWDAGGR